MENKMVNRQSVLDALTEIDKEGFRKGRNSTKYDLHYDGKIYPPKLVLSIAARQAGNQELEPSEFYGGKQTNSFLIELGFVIKDKNGQLQKK